MSRFWSVIALVSWFWLMLDLTLHRSAWDVAFSLASVLWANFWLYRACREDDKAARRQVVFVEVRR